MQRISKASRSETPIGDICFCFLRAAAQPTEVDFALDVLLVWAGRGGTGSAGRFSCVPSWLQSLSEEWMETREAIAGRRSIRKFRSDSLSEATVREILEAGIQATSGKKRQPWRFVVVQGTQRQRMIEIMRAGVAKSKEQQEDLGSCEWTITVMQAAPVTVFVFNQEGVRPWLAHSIGENFSDLVNVQSVGAAIQNMLLAAHDAGIGSLWICDVFYAYEDLCNWLGEDGQLVAAVSFGYPDEVPDARPRMQVDEVTRWV